jgi:hypothetical protein
LPRSGIRRKKSRALSIFSPFQDAASFLALAGAGLIALLGGPGLGMDWVNGLLAAEIEQRSGRNAVSIERSSLRLDDQGVALAVSGLRSADDRNGNAAIARGLVRLDSAALLEGRLAPVAVEIAGAELALGNTPNAVSMLVTGSTGKPPAAFGELLQSLLREESGGLALSFTGISVDLPARLSAPGMRLQGVDLKTGRDDKGRFARLTLPNLGTPVTLRLLPGAGANGQTKLDIEAKGVPLALLEQLSGISMGAGPLARLSAAGELVLDASGMPLAGRLDVSLDGAVLALPRAAALPVTFRGSLDWSSDRLTIGIREAELSGEGFSLTGSANVTPGAADIAVELRDGTLKVAAGPWRSKPLDLSLLAADLAVSTAGDWVKLTRLEATGDEIALSASLAYGRETGIAGSADFKETGLVTAIETVLEPLLAEPGLREELRITQGRIDSMSLSLALDADALVQVLEGGQNPIAALSGKARFTGVSQTGADGFPGIADASGIAVLEKGGLTITAEQARATFADGKSQPLDRLKLVFPQIVKPQTLSLSLAFDGSIKSLRERIRTLPLPKQVVTAIGRLGDSGAATASVSAEIGLSKRKGRLDLSSFEAELKKATLKSDDEGFADLTDADLAIKASATSLVAKGSGRLGGLPVTLEHKAVGITDQGFTTVEIIIDEAARRDRGFDFGRALAGPLVVSLERRPGRVTAQEIKVDLTKVAIRDLVPGWSKPAGRKASATMIVKDRGKDGFRLEEFRLDGGALKAGGTITLSRAGSLREARFDTLKLPGGETGSAEISRSGERWRVALKANALDARPWMVKLDDLSGARGASVPIDLSISATALQGNNGEIIAGAELGARFSERGASDVKFSGTLNGAQVVAKMEPSGDGAVLRLRSDDAGGLMRFLDIYGRMSGGRLEGRILFEPGRQSGVVAAQNFILTNEPALRSVVAQSGPSASESRTKFSKGRVRFSRNAGRIRLSEAVMWGDAIGGNITGEIDYANDTIDLSGSFVPAYALNNLFAQLPLVGPILGGESYEGLFAVPFTISGQASSPRLTVNALSAVAPGILRKLLDFKDQRPGVPPQ